MTKREDPIHSSGNLSMLKELANISKYTVPFVAVLYFFGFISVTSFLSHFGIISFDIINSRIIVAGILSLIAVLLPLLLVWRAIFDILSDSFLEQKNIVRRIASYIIIYLMAYLVSVTLKYFYGLGRHVDPKPQDSLIFKTFGGYDFLGNFINQFNFYTPALNFVLKLSLTLFAYSLFIYLSGILIYSIANFFLKSKMRSESLEVPKGDSPLSQKDASRKKEISLFRIRFLRVVEIFLSIFGIALFIYSAQKLYVYLFDFSTLLSNPTLTEGLLFSWAYSLIAVLFLSLLLAEARKGRSLSQVLKNGITDPSLLHQAVTYGLIPLLFFLWTFGQVIFPRIPYAIGGGEPREITLGTRDGSRFQDKGSRFFLLGESNKFFFLVRVKDDAREVYQLNKDVVDFISIVQK